MVISATAQEIYVVSLLAWLPLMSVSATMRYLLNSMRDKVNAVQRKYKLFCEVQHCWQAFFPYELPECCAQKYCMFMAYFLVQEQLQCQSSTTNIFGITVL